MYYKRNSLRFQCTQCGACCTGDDETGVFVDRAEAEALREALGLSRNWFYRRYLVQLDGGSWEVQLRDDGRCPFLTDEGGCSVYSARPKQCRTYPFWPEIVETARTWKAEAKRCEGIGKGPVIPVVQIEQRLRECEE
jgi:Fe-S-cluster containining protein